MARARKDSGTDQSQWGPFALAQCIRLKGTAAAETQAGLPSRMIDSDRIIPCGSVDFIVFLSFFVMLQCRSSIIVLFFNPGLDIRQLSASAH